MITQIKNSIIRRIARAYILRLIDGKKKEIGRIFLGVQMIIFAVVKLWPDTEAAQVLSAFLNETLILIAWLGLELGIEDEEIKRKEGIE